MIQYENIRNHSFRFCHFSFTFCDLHQRLLPSGVQSTSPRVSRVRSKHGSPNALVLGRRRVAPAQAASVRHRATSPHWICAYVFSYFWVEMIPPVQLILLITLYTFALLEVASYLY